MRNSVHAKDLLRFIRKQRGYTQYEVSLAFEVDTRTYQRWESGETAVSFDTLNRLITECFKLPLITAMELAIDGITKR